MNNKLLTALLIASTLVILVSGMMIVTNASSEELEKTDQARAQVLGEKSHDWGEIDIDGGIKEQEFVIKNEGTEVLELSNVKTSCSCTEAQLFINEKRSPIFGMHTNSGWVGRVAPGETATLKVGFDPAFHGPQGTGPITRLIAVETNDASNPVIEFELTGNVFSSEDE